MRAKRGRWIWATPSARVRLDILHEFHKRTARGPHPEGGWISAGSPALLPALQAGLEADGQTEAFEVLTFPRLVHRTLAHLGQPAAPVPTEMHLQAALEKACERVAFDSPFHRSAGFPGFRRALQSTLHELSHWGLTAGTLTSLAENAPERLAAKLRSLASVEQDVEGSLAELGRETPHRQLLDSLDLLTEPETPFPPLLVFLGPEPDPLRLRWLHWVAERGQTVWIVAESAAAGQPLFETVRRLGLETGFEVLEVLPANALGQTLFSAQTTQEPFQARELRAPDPLAEAEWAIRGCLEAREQGISLGRMAIYARDLAAYAPLLQAASERLGAPLRMHRREPLLHGGFARLMLDTLRACVSTDIRDLAFLNRSSYLGVSREGRAAIAEAFREAYRTGAQSWESLRAWESLDGFPWLRALLDWRMAALREPTSLGRWYERFTELSQALLQDAFARPGERVQEERDQRALVVMQQTLAAAASVEALGGAVAYRLADFVRWAERTWESADVSLPSAEHGISVVSQAEALGDLDALFVLGMLEGVFPKRRREEPILSDAERAQIAALAPELPALPHSRDKARAERDEFYRVCVAPTAQVVFSYPLTDDDQDNIPAFYLEEVRRALDGRVEVQTRKRREFAPPEDAALAESDRRLARAFGERRAPLPNALELASTAERLRWSEGEALTPLDVRDASQCSFRFFARKLLGLRPNRVTNRWAALRALPQRAGLQAAPEPIAARQALERTLKEELDRIAPEIQPWELAMLRSGGERLIEEWLQREFAARRLWPRNEAPRGPVSFGSPALRGELCKIPLRGEVAGIAEIGRYATTQLYEPRPPEKMQGELEPGDALYYGLHLLAAHRRGLPGALEIETMRGERHLLLLPRVPGSLIPARVQEGLYVQDLGRSDDPDQSQRLFFEDLKERLRAVRKRLETLETEPSAGEHCRWCDFGELCRRSLEYGEEPDPFQGPADMS